MIRMIAFVAASLIAVQSHAQAADGLVSFDRAALADPAEAAALYEDIVEAAEDVCRAALRGSPFYHHKFRPCVSDAVNAAVAEIDAPLLTAHAGGERARARLASAN